MLLRPAHLTDATTDQRVLVDDKKTGIVPILAADEEQPSLLADTFLSNDLLARTLKLVPQRRALQVGPARPVDAHAILHGRSLGSLRPRASVERPFLVASTFGGRDRSSEPPLLRLIGHQDGKGFVAPRRKQSHLDPWRTIHRRHICAWRATRRHYAS